MGRQPEEHMKFDNYKSDPPKAGEAGHRSQNIMNDNAMGFKKKKEQIRQNYHFLEKKWIF